MPNRDPSKDMQQPGPKEGDVEEPPRKTRHQVVFQVGTTTQGLQGGRHLPKLFGSNLPLNLQDPGFQFEGPPQPDVSPSHSAPETWFQNLSGEQAPGFFRLHFELILLGVFRLFFKAF